MNSWIWCAISIAISLRWWENNERSFFHEIQKEPFVFSYFSYHTAATAFSAAATVSNRAKISAPLKRFACQKKFWFLSQSKLLEKSIMFHLLAILLLTRSFPLISGELRHIHIGIKWQCHATHIHNEGSKEWYEWEFDQSDQNMLFLYTRGRAGYGSSEDVGFSDGVHE